MLAKRRAFGTLVVAVALFVAGCSSGGGKQSTPTTVRPLSLGSCPKTEPNTDLTKVNTGVKGLDRVLVPITAVQVRMSRYSLVPGAGLIGERTLVSSDAARFEAETNRFPASLPTTLPAPPPYSPSGSQGLVGDEGCMQEWRHLVTFASDSQQVEIYEDGCGAVSNGVLGAQSTAQWFSELQHDTAAALCSAPQMTALAPEWASPLSQQTDVLLRFTNKGAACELSGYASVVAALPGHPDVSARAGIPGIVLATPDESVFVLPSGSTTRVFVAALHPCIGPTRRYTVLRVAMPGGSSITVTLPKRNVSANPSQNGRDLTLPVSRSCPLHVGYFSH